MIAENTQTSQICESVFRVIRPPSVLSHTLHETTDRNVKLRNDRHFSNNYQIIIYKSFNYSNIRFDILYLEFFNETTNEI